MTGKHAPLLDRLTAKLDMDGDCWEFTGSRDSNGYGRINRGGNLGPALAHRLAWELVVGPIPDGLVLDHLCRNPPCVNPDHLEPVTQRLNTMRGEAPGVLLHVAGTCKNGHDLDEHGSRRSSGPRAGCVVYCRACRRERRARS